MNSPSHQVISSKAWIGIQVSPTWELECLTTYLLGLLVYTSDDSRRKRNIEEVWEVCDSRAGKRENQDLWTGKLDEEGKRNGGKAGRWKRWREEIPWRANRKEKPLQLPSWGRGLSYGIFQNMGVGLKQVAPEEAANRLHSSHIQKQESKSSWPGMRGNTIQ